MSNIQTFESYLEEVCFEANSSVLDDDMLDFFEGWYASQDIDDMVRHAENYGNHIRKQTIEECRSCVPTSADRAYNHAVEQTLSALNELE